VHEGYGAGRCNCQFTDNYPHALGRDWVPPISSLKKPGPSRNRRNLLQPADVSYLTNWRFSASGSTSRWNNPGAEPSNILKDDRRSIVWLNWRPHAHARSGLRPGLGQLNAPGTMFDRNGARPGRVVQ
jgi:hypothetical protein